MKMTEEQERRLMSAVGRKSAEYALMLLLTEDAEEQDGVIVSGPENARATADRLRRVGVTNANRGVVKGCKARLKKEGLIQMRGNGVYVMFPEKGGEMTAGKAKVLAGSVAHGTLTCIGPSKYEGTCRLRNGKFERKLFKVSDLSAAKSMWENWCLRIRSAYELDMNAEHRKPEPNAAGGTAAKDAKTERVEPPSTQCGRIYCIMTTGGEPFRYTTDPDKALAVCEVLQDAAKAAGMPTEYNVSEVEPWTLS